MREVITEARAAQILKETGIDLSITTAVPLTTFDPDTGRIIQTVEHGMGIALYLSQSEGNHIIGRPPENTYVDVKTKRFVRREPCPARAEGLDLLDLPQPCVLEIFDESGAFKAYDCKDGKATLEFSLPGTYTIGILSVPYLNGILTVTAP